MNFKNGKYQIILGVISGIAVSIVAIFFYKFFLMPYYQVWHQEKLIESDTYQAVFLDDKQIYFGKLRDIDSQYPILDDVYYVKLDSEEATTGRLVKLGETEPHAPRDQMIINRNHILFWENLKDDSQVIQTIRDLKLNQ